jgi:hypothetical protein
VTGFNARTVPELQVADESSYLPFALGSSLEFVSLSVSRTTRSTRSSRSSRTSPRPALDLVT